MDEFACAIDVLCVQQAMRGTTSRIQEVLQLGKCGVRLPRLEIAVLGHEKSARIYFRACRFNQAHAVSPDDLIRCLGRVLHTVNLLHAEDGVGPRSPLDVFD